MSKRVIRLTESGLRRIISESVEALLDWFRGSKVVDRNGRPMLLYHAHQSDGNGGSYGSAMVYYTSDLEYAREFGDVIDSGYLKLVKPYITKDGLLRREDGSVVTDEEGHYMGVGYLDMLSEKDLEYFRSRYDGMMDGEDGYMVVSFRSGNFYKMGTEVE